MQRLSGAIEDLPPLELTPLRDLDIEASPRPGRPAHIAAGSGVVRRGDYVYVIGDDELFLGVFRLSSPAPGRLHRVLSGQLPIDDEQRKAAKPDLEALTVLPPFAGHPFGALLGLGSGSAANRDRGFVCPLAPDGSLRGDAVEIDLSGVYRLLREHVAELNVEGACAMGECLWLLQRGNGEDGLNLVAELSLADVMSSLRRDRRIDAQQLEAVRSYDLGELDGVPLTFSDGAPLGGDVLVFTASAEGGGDAVRDGEIRGSVVGTLDRDGRVRRLRMIDRRFKVEGVHASIETGVIDFLFVSDQDDPHRPSPLLCAAMPVDARFEREN